MNDAETLFQYGREYSEIPEKIRVSSRAIITDGNKILLSHELNTGVYLIPGGGLESGETLEECCKREIREETGYEISVGKQLYIFKEYFRNMLYVSNYFLCEITGKGEQSLTESEINHGVIPEWAEINKALEIFGSYGDYAETDEEIEGQYKREYTVICKYFNKLL